MAAAAAADSLIIRELELSTIATSEGRAEHLQDFGLPQFQSIT
jgi:hypothetical protein